MTKKSRSKNANCPPLKGGLLQELVKEANPKARVPEGLVVHEDLSTVKPYVHNIIERGSLADVSDKPVKSLQPEWMAASVKPRRMRLIGMPTRKLWHYGVEVDPLYIWGADDRRAYNDTNYPWRCVCKILTAGGGYGSGVIVGPRHVLTASHIVDWSRNGAGVVEVHRAGPAVSASTAITGVWYYTKITSRQFSNSDADEDYALLVTQSRIGDRFGYLGTRTYNSSWDDEPYWHNIGYAPGIIGAAYPLHQKDKDLDEDEWDLGSARAMRTSADVEGGQSGSPMFGFWEDGPYVVAVVSSSGDDWYYGKENWCAGGSDLTRLVRHAKKHDP